MELGDAAAEPEDLAVGSEDGASALREPVGSEELDELTGSRAARGRSQGVA